MVETETETYTYQGGRKLPLARSRTRFISRAARAQLLEGHFDPIESVSAHSWSVRAEPDSLDDDIRRARRLGPAYAAYVVAATGRDFLVTDRIFIRFKRESDPERFGAKHDLELVAQFSPLDCLFRVRSSEDVVDVVRRITETEADEVEIVDHDLNVLPLQHQLNYADPLFPDQWYLRSDPAGALVAKRALPDCQGAWDRCGLGSREVVIAVIDCGCDLNDRNFDDQKFAGWALFQDGVLHTSAQLGAAKRSVMEPRELHGTLCASLAAASANQYGGLGAAPACSLLPVKWYELGTGIALPQSLFIEVINFVRDRADVVTSSWGLGPHGYWPPAVCDKVRDAALYGGRQGKGLVWIWSVGNSNAPIQFKSDVPVPTRVRSDGRKIVVEEWEQEFVNSFVGIPGVIHVGAISSLGQRCHYSNYGPGLDLVAPSNNRHLYGRLSVTGVEMVAPLSADGLHTFGGTSAAAPLVAGVAALVRSANPSLTAQEVVSVLHTTADKDLDMNGYPSCSLAIDPERGWDISPIPPFDDGSFRDIGHDDGLWSPWFGFGKVNARKAVEEAIRRRIEGEQ